MNKSKAYNKAVRIVAETTRKALVLAKKDLINMFSDTPDPGLSKNARIAFGEYTGQLALICELFDVSEWSLTHDVEEALNEEE